MDGEKGESFCLSFDGKVSRGEFLIIEKKKQITKKAATLPF